jgi:ankyrin repeat protein
VKVLVEQGRADFDVRDRWSLDPLDEAMRERREPVVKYLQDSGALFGGS